jgi:hypothetical protein
MRLVDRLILPAMLDRGPMTNAEIYRGVRRRAARAGLRLSPNWRATVRNTLQRHAKGNRKCKERALFLHIDRNLWKVRSRIQ